MSTLHELVKSGNDFERLRNLLKTGENANAIDEDENTLLHIVASKKRTDPEDIEGSVRMAGVLIEFGADMNKKDERGYVPLLRAVIAENRKMVEFLLVNNADIHVIDYCGNTALHLAIKETEQPEDFPDWDEYYAARKPILDMVKTILRFHPNVNKRNECKKTPLLLAAEYRDFPVVQNLLKQKASVHIYNRSGTSPMYYALNRPGINLDLVIELFRHGAEFYRRVLNDTVPMTLYLRFLRNAPLAEMEKAKCVFRLFLLGNEYLTPSHESKIEEISTLKNFPLSRYIRNWENEISRMKKDKLASKFSFYNMAQRGFFCLTEERREVFSHFFDAVLHKLKNSKYPLYRDMIMSGLGRSYLEGKFAEACVILRRTGREFLDDVTSRMLYPYLSRVDILSCIKAFSV